MWLTPAPHAFSYMGPKFECISLRLLYYYVYHTLNVIVMRPQLMVVGLENIHNQFILIVPDSIGLIVC